MTDIKKVRDWVFTLNNYSDDEIERLSGLKTDYLVYGKEIGESGTPHLQGFFYLPNPRTLKGLKKEISSNIHLEQKYHHASFEQASNYCKKGEQSHDEWNALGTKGPNYGLNADVFETGQLPAQGERNDLFEIKKHIEEGVSQEEIATTYFAQWVQYGRRFEDYRKLRQQKRNWKTNVIVYWGESGAGKSHMAFELYPRADKVSFTGQFFIGYKHSEVVIFEDFDPTKLPLDLYLNITDKYPFTINIKNGEAEWNPKTIIFTTNYKPSSWYDGSFKVLRRIDEDWLFFMTGTEEWNRSVHSNTENGHCDRKTCKIHGLSSRD